MLQARGSTQLAGAVSPRWNKFLIHLTTSPFGLSAKTSKRSRLDLKIYSFTTVNEQSSFWLLLFTKCIEKC